MIRPKVRKADLIKEKDELEAVLAAEEASLEQDPTLDDLFKSWIAQGVDRAEAWRRLAIAKNRWAAQPMRLKPPVLVD